MAWSRTPRGKWSEMCRTAVDRTARLDHRRDDCIRRKFSGGWYGRWYGRWYGGWCGGRAATPVRDEKRGLGEPGRSEGEP